MRVGVQPEWLSTPHLGGSNEDYDEQNSVASSVSRRSAPKRHHVYGDGGQTELDSCVYWSTFSFFAVLNSIDLLVSGGLTVFAVYLADRLGPMGSLPFYVSSLVYAYAILGASILVEVLLSFSALAFVSCRQVLYVPQQMTFILGLLAFVTGVLAFVVEGSVFSYLNSHTYEYGLGQLDIETMRVYYHYAAAASLGAVPPLQGVRYCMSQRLAAASDLLHGEFENDLLLDEHEKHLRDDDQLHLVKDVRAEKYHAAARGGYQSRYDPV
jgi:hypothetical protein